MFITIKLAMLGLTGLTGSLYHIVTVQLSGLHKSIILRT